MIFFIAYHRQVCCKWNAHRQTCVGGPGKIVEIDEMVFGKQKNRLGQKVEVQWVFGGVERGAARSRFFFEPVARRDAPTLIEIIERCVEPGSIIMSDGWAAYKSLGQRGYNHLTVNHNVHFVDPKTKAHIQNCERMWREARSNIPR